MCNLQVSTYKRTGTYGTYFIYTELCLFAYSTERLNWNELTRFSFWRTDPSQPSIPLSARRQPSPQLWRPPPSPSPLYFFVLSVLSLFVALILFFSVRVRWNGARGSGEAPWAPPAGSGAEPQPKSNLVNFCFKRQDMVAIIIIIFRRINLPVWQI